MKLSPFRVTDAGRRMLGKLLQGRATTTFSNVKISGLHYTEEQIAQMSSLEMVWAEAPVTKLLIIDSSTVQIEASMDNIGQTEDQIVGTVGLYAVDPDLNEILYAASNVQDGSILPAFGGDKTAVGLAFKFEIAVGNTAVIDVKVDPNGYATVRDARALRKAIMLLAEAVAGGGGDPQLLEQLRSGMLDITGDDNDDVNVHPPVVDKTLTQSGAAADAKTVGEFLRTVRAAAFDTVYVDVEGYLHFTLDGEDSVMPAYIGTPSDGGGGLLKIWEEGDFDADGS